MTVGVAKLGLHAWLVPDLPNFPPYETDLKFESAGTFDAVVPTLIYLATLAFDGEGGVTVAAGLDPPFGCASPNQTLWSDAGLAATAFAYAAVPAIDWRCADGRAAPVIDRLADVAGDLLVYVNADRIRLI